MSSITAQRNHSAEIRRTLHLATPVIIGQVAMLMFVIGLLMAIQPTVAQLDGAGKRSEAGKAGRQATWIALSLSFPYVALLWFSEPLFVAINIDPQIIPTAAGYLKALAWGAPAACGMFMLRFFSEGSGRTRPTMYIGFLGVALNIPLNWILMYGKFGMPALGAVGCGYATAIVLWVLMLSLLWYIHWHPHYREFKFFQRLGPPDRVILTDLVRVGLPIAVMIFVEGSLFVAAALLIGRLGPLPSASHLVAINFAALTFMIPLGLASAVTIRVGNAIGRGEPDAARYAGLIGLLIVLGTQSISASVMFLAPEAIVRIYTNDIHVIALASSLLFFAAIFQFSDGIQVISAGALRGLKDTKVPMLYTVIAYWLVGMTLGYYLTFDGGMGPAGMWIGMIAGLSVGAAFLLARFLRSSARLVRAGLDDETSSPIR
jgi:MATE family multidrug resistance protein